LLALEQVLEHDLLRAMIEAVALEGHQACATYQIDLVVVGTWRDLDPCVGVTCH